MARAKHILVVDDEPNVRLVFRTALEGPGRTVTSVADGQAALARIAEVGCDLLVLDLQMPVMDGMETLQKLREQGSEVPVLIVTAHGSIPDAVRAMQLGAIDFLSKPLTPEALRRGVDEVLARFDEQRRAQVAPAPAITADSEFRDRLDRAKRSIHARRFTEAEVFLRQALALNERSAEVQNLLGVVREIESDWTSAYRAYRAALKIDPHYTPAANNLKRHSDWHIHGVSDDPIDLGDA